MNKQRLSSYSDMQIWQEQRHRWERPRERGEAKLGEPSDAGHGLLGDHAHLPPRRRRRLPLLAPLLQPRAVHQPIPFDLGHYSYNLLLDDVGNRLSFAAEAFDQPHPERGVTCLFKNLISSHAVSLFSWVRFGTTEIKYLLWDFATLPQDTRGGTLWLVYEIVLYTQ